VLVEEVAADAEHLRGLSRADRQTRKTGLAGRLRPLTAAVVGPKELKRELSGMSRHFRVV
jgi:hypothetical protein